LMAWMTPSAFAQRHSSGSSLTYDPLKVMVPERRPHPQKNASSLPRSCPAHESRACVQ
jgi:hypothetical protein